MFFVCKNQKYIRRFQSCTKFISLFFSKNSDTELSALSIDDFDLSGIDTDIYDVEYDLDCGIINIVKKSTVPATSTGSSSGSSTGTSSGSGTVSTETTIVYYNFTEVTTIESGKTYFYNKKTKATSWKHPQNYLNF